MWAPPRNYMYANDTERYIYTKTGMPRYDKTRRVMQPDFLKNTIKSQNSDDYFVFDSGLIRPSPYK